MKLRAHRFWLAGMALLAAATGAHAQGALLPGGNSKAPVSINSSKLDYFDKEQKLV